MPSASEAHACSSSAGGSLGCVKTRQNLLKSVDGLIATSFSQPNRGLLSVAFFLLGCLHFFGLPLSNRVGGRV
jgi:hypothetical protein